MGAYLLLPTVGLVLAWVLAVLYTAWVLIHPPRRTFASAIARSIPADPSDLSPPRHYECWTLRSRGMDLPVWDIEGDDPDGPILVLVHGWGDSRIGALPRLEAVAPNVSRVVALDLPGHGEAPGWCALGTLEVDDLHALVDQLALPRERLVLMGWSMGAGIAIEVGARTPGMRGVIAEAPYRLARTPARNVLRQARLPWRLNLTPAFWLLNAVLRGRLRDARFDRARHARQLRCPLLVLHGELDEVCPIDDGRDIAQAAPQGTLSPIALGDHNGLWTNESTRPLCIREVRRFLDEVDPRGRESSPQAECPPHP